MPDANVLESPLLAKHGFAHGFSLRHDEPGARMRAHLAPRLVHQADQVHGAAVARAGGDPATTRTEKADAVIARAPHAAGVRVADCVPVLVGDVGVGSVAAIHAGWRGVVLGVVPAALAALAALASEDGEGASGTTSRLVAAIGPSIGPCCFEVGDDVAAQIAAACPGARVIARRSGEKALIDLRAAVRAQLVAAGLADADIDDVAGCTKCDSARFFSFRRDGANAGRHVGAIAARPPLPSR